MKLTNEKKRSIRETMCFIHDICADCEECLDCPFWKDKRCIFESLPAHWPVSTKN